MLECSCSASPLKEGCYAMNITFTEYSATITINRELASQASGGVDARIGHEQLHISNEMKFNQALVTAVAPWEAVIFITKQECDDKASAIMKKYSELKRKFNDHEVKHENFLLPEASKGYKKTTSEIVVEKGAVLPNTQIEYIPPDYKVDFERL
jgi:hypothetical protein